MVLVDAFFCHKPLNQISYTLTILNIGVLTAFKSCCKLSEIANLIEHAQIIKENSAKTICIEWDDLFDWQNNKYLEAPYRYHPEFDDRTKENVKDEKDENDEARFNTKYCDNLLNLYYFEFF